MGLLPLLFGAAAAAAGVAAVSSHYRKYLLALLVLSILAVAVFRLASSIRSLCGLAAALMVGAIFLLPSDYLPVTKHVLGLSVDPTLLLAVIAALSPASRARLPGPALIFPIVVAVFGLAAYLEVPSDTARFFLLSFIVVSCVLYIAALKASGTTASLEAASTVIMWSTGLGSTLGIVEFILRRNPVYGRYYPPAGPNAGGALYFPGTLSYRITTTIGHPLAVAGILSAGLLVTLGILVNSDDKRKRRLALIVIVLAGVAITMTKGRTAIILTPVLAIVFVLLVRLPRYRFSEGRSRSNRIGLLATLLAIPLILLATKGIWSERFDTSTSAASNEARVLGFHYVESTLPSAIPFGLGLNAAQSRAASQGLTIASATAEDGWAELLIDGGPVFLVALLCMPAFGVFSALRRNRDPDGSIRLAYAVASLFLIIDGTSFDGAAAVPRTFLLLTVVTGAYAIPSR